MSILSLHTYHHEYTPIMTTELDRQILQNIPKQTVLATTTMYPSKGGVMTKENELRAKLALRTMKAAQQIGYKIIVVDSGSDTGWREEIKNTGATLIEEDLHFIPGTHTMGRSRRQAFIAAGNTHHKIIGWLEPEKHPYILAADGHSPAAAAAYPVFGNEADIVIPRRLDELASYPLQQRHEELTTNLTITNLLQDSTQCKIPYLDWSMGPRMMNRTGLDYFINYDGKIAGDNHDRWECLYVPVFQALFDNKKIVGVPVHYIHPEEQTKFESSDASYDLKRIEQLATLASATHKFIQTHNRT